MTIMLSLLRGLVFYIALFGLGTGLAWGILPWRYGMSASSPQMMMAVMGGGVLLLLIIIISFSSAPIK